MVEKHLPGGADIHGGGTDLRFPHHENELAQSAGAHPDRTFVRAWAHHGMVTLGAGGKMAKSLGNILDVERSEEHTSELQSRQYLVCRLLLEKKDTVGRHCRVLVLVHLGT